MSQSLLMAVRIDTIVVITVYIDSFRTDVTVSQPREIALGETLLCYSQ